MALFRATLSLVFIAAMLTLGGELKLGQSSAQASISVNENTSARDAATSREDITLTNSCIEAGQEKTHCLCVTKVFKYQMSLREYEAAVKLYKSSRSSDPTAHSATKISLRQRGYKDQEIINITNFQSQLLDKSSLTERCETAADYYDDSAL